MQWAVVTITQSLHPISLPCACEFDRPYPPVPVEWYSPLIFLDHSEMQITETGKFGCLTVSVLGAVDCHQGVIWVHKSNKGLPPSLC